MAARGLGPWLMEHDITLVFNAAAVVIVHHHGDLPSHRARAPAAYGEPGNSEEEAALPRSVRTDGRCSAASPFNIRAALLCGMVLCFARALGEFGSVCIVSGAVRGETNTMTLQIDSLYHDYNTAGAFALASLLTLISLVTLLVKTRMETRA